MEYPLSTLVDGMNALIRGIYRKKYERSKKNKTNNSNSEEKNEFGAEKPEGFTAYADRNELMGDARKYLERSDLTSRDEKLRECLNRRPKLTMGTRDGKTRISSYDFTVLVPAYNGENYLEKLLKDLEPYKDRVLVVDDGSKDKTGDVARKNSYKLVVNPTNGKKIGAVAKGLENVDTTYTVLIDADSRIKHGKIEDLVGMMYGEDLDACAVRVMPSTTEGVLEKLQSMEYAKAMSIGRGSMDGDKPAVPCVSGAFGVFRTDMLKEVTEEQMKNGFHWEGEDFERTLRFIEKGGRVSYCDDFLVVTDVPTTLKDYTKQRIKWQHGYMRCHWDFKKMLLRKDKLGATFVFNYVFNLIGQPLKLLSVPALIGSGTEHPELLPLFYGIYCGIEAACAKTSLSKEDWKKFRKYIPLMPLYGLYNLVGPTTIGYLKCANEKIREKLKK